MFRPVSLAYPPSTQRPILSPRPLCTRVYSFYTPSPPPRLLTLTPPTLDPIRPPYPLTMAQPPHPHHGPSPSPSPYPPYNPLMSADLAALAQQGYAQQQAQLQARAAAQSHTPSQSSQPPPPPGSNPSPHHPAMMNMHHQARAGPSMPPGMAGMAPGMGGHYPALGGQHIPPMGQMQMSPMQMGQMQMGQMVPMGSSPGMPMPMGNVPAHMGQLQHAQMQAFGQAPVTPQQLQQQQQQQQPPPPPPPQGRMAPGPGQYKPERRVRIDL